MGLSDVVLDGEAAAGAKSSQGPDKAWKEEVSKKAKKSQKALRRSSSSYSDGGSEEDGEYMTEQRLQRDHEPIEEDVPAVGCKMRGGGHVECEEAACIYLVTGSTWRRGARVAATGMGGSERTSI